MLTVKFTGTDGVEGFVVDAAQKLTTVNIFPQPFCKLGLNKLLPVLCNGGFLFVEHTLLIAVIIVNDIKDTHILLVQSLLQNVIRIDPLCAIGAEGTDIAAVRAFVGNIPFSGCFGMEDLDFALGIAARAEQLIHEFLVDFGGYPVHTDTHTDLTCSQIHGLHGFQSRYIAADGIFLFGW